MLDKAPAPACQQDGNESEEEYWFSFKNSIKNVESKASKSVQLR
jgi:hypothetical protein